MFGKHSTIDFYHQLSFYSLPSPQDKVSLRIPGCPRTSASGLYLTSFWLFMQLPGIQTQVIIMLTQLSHQTLLFFQLHYSNYVDFIPQYACICPVLKQVGFYQAHIVIITCNQNNSSFLELRCDNMPSWLKNRVCYHRVVAARAFNPKTLEAEADVEYLSLRLAWFRVPGWPVLHGETLT